MRYLSLVRHAATDWNLQGRVQGHSDVPLAEAGEAQARALRARFEGESVLLYSSPLERARKTAALAFPDHEPILDPRLSELNFGLFEGRTQPERLMMRAWRDWTEPFSTPAPGGESYGELYERAVAWFESLPDAPHIVAVTHSGTIQTLLMYLLQLETKGWRKRFQLGHTSVTGFLLGGPQTLLERLNDLHHLLHPPEPGPAEPERPYGAQQTARTAEPEAPAEP